MTPSVTEPVTLTADVAVFGYRDDKPHVLLVRRAYEPFADHWALPGGKVEPGEEVFDAAFRELVEETDIVFPEKALPLFVGTYTAPGRDPRGRYVTQVWAVALDWSVGTPEATAGDDAADALWVPLDHLFGQDPVRLAFDHLSILVDAVARVGILDGRGRPFRP